MDSACRQLLSALSEAHLLLRQELRVQVSSADSLRPQDLQQSATEVTLRHISWDNCVDQSTAADLSRGALQV